MNIRTRLMFLVLLATLLPASLIGLRFIQDRSENVAWPSSILKEPPIVSR